MRLWEFLGLGGFNPGVTAKQWDGKSSFATQVNPKYTNALNDAAEEIATMVSQAANKDLQDAIISDAARHYNLNADELQKRLQELNVIKETTLVEGVHDPHIFKAIFITGTPGAGKTTIARRLQGMTGLRRVDYDQFHELALRQGRQVDFERIIHLRDTRLTAYMDRRLGLLIEESGRKHERLKETKLLLEQLGYDTLMVFANVSLEVAKQRVAKRAAETGRDVAPDYLEMVHRQAQANLGHAQHLFGKNFIVVEADQPQSIEVLDKQVRKFLATPPQNPVAKDWILQHRREAVRT
jgi:cytidylate kinase